MSLVVSLIGILLAKWLILLVAGRDFLPVVPAAQIVLLSIPPQCATVMIVSYLAGIGRPQSEIVSSLVEASVVAALAFSIIPLIGVEGAAIADLVGAFAQMFVAISQFTSATGARASIMFGLRRSDVIRLKVAFASLMPKKVGSSS